MWGAQGWRRSVCSVLMWNIIGTFITCRSTRQVGLRIMKRWAVIVQHYALRLISSSLPLQLVFHSYFCFVVLPRVSGAFVQPRLWTGCNNLNPFISDGSYRLMTFLFKRFQRLWPGWSKRFVSVNVMIQTWRRQLRWSIDPCRGPAGLSVQDWLTVTAHLHSFPSDWAFYFSQVRLQERRRSLCIHWCEGVLSDRAGPWYRLHSRAILQQMILSDWPSALINFPSFREQAQVWATVNCFLLEVIMIDLPLD